MKLKKLLSAGMLLVGLVAQASNISLIVELKDSKKYDFLLDEKPVVTFQDGDLVVNGNSETSYAISNVKNCHFETDYTAVEAVKASDLRIVYVNENAIQVQNAVANAQVSIISVSGVVFSKQKADAEGAATLQLPTEKGVYVVTVGDKSFKVIRK